MTTFGRSPGRNARPRIGFDIAKGGLGPGVAERWVLSEDGLAWTFYLRLGQTR